MKRRLMIGAVGLVGMLAALVVHGRPSRVDKPRPALAALTSFHEQKTGFSFSYPADLTMGALTPGDDKEHIVFRATQPSAATTPFLITARYETGLQLVSSVSKQKVIDIVLAGAQRSLPKRFPEYTQVSSRRFQLAGLDAAEIIYTYTSPVDKLTKETIKQRLLLIAQDTNTAVYLSAQARAGDYDRVNGDTFDRVFKSAHF